MIIFEFDTEIYVDGKLYDRTLFWLGSIKCTGSDTEHQCEIYEQLDSESSGLTEV